MALSPRVSAVDRLIAGFNAALAVVWLALAGRGGHAIWLAVAHLAMVALPWLLHRVPRRRWGAAVALRDTYPLVLIGAYWTEIDVLRKTIGPGSFDHLIEPLDRFVFGTHLHEVWLPSMDGMWMSETMYFMYYAYYALIFIPPLVVVLQGRRAALRDMMFRLTVTYLACYAVFIAFPVDGPHFLLTPHQGPHTEGFFYRLVAAAQASGDSRGCAFPSSHVTGAVTIALLGWRWFRWPFAALLSVEALGVVLSTVYTQNHYAIDSAAGIVWALGLQLALAPGLRRWLSGGTWALPAQPARPPVSAPAFAQDGQASEAS